MLKSKFEKMIQQSVDRDNETDPHYEAQKKQESQALIPQKKTVKKPTK